MALTKVTGHVVLPTTNIEFHNTKSTGIVTFTHTSNATSSTTGALQITGGVGIVKDLFVGGNVTVGGTITYDDVTNVDSLGIITARGGIHVGPPNAGVATVSSNGSASFTGIVTTSSTLFAKYFSSSGIATFSDIHVKSNADDTRITSIAPGALILSRTTPVILFKNNLSDSFDASIDVVSNELRFKGGGNNATSTRMITTSSGVSFPQNIDVDGQTDLDDVSVSGVGTFTGQIFQTAPGSSTAKLTLNNASDTTGMDVGYSESSGAGFINVGQSGSGLSIKTGGLAAGNERFVITSGGNVGIASNAPAERLVVQGDGFSNLAYDKDGGGFDGTSGGALVLTGIFDYSGSKLGMMVDNAGQGRIFTKTAQALHLGTGNSKDLTINNVGSVGVNTDIISQKFAVKGATDIMHYPNTTIGNDRLQIGFNAPEGYIKSKNSSGSPASNLAFYTTNTSGTTSKRLHLSYNGRILTGGETAVDEVSEGGIHIKTTNNGGNTHALILENHGSSTGTQVIMKFAPTTSTTNDRWNSINVVNVDGQNKFDTAFYTCPGGTPLEAMRIDNQQRLLIGTYLSDTRHEVGDAALQVSGTGAADSGIAVGRWSANNQPAFLELSKSRNGTITGHTAVQADDILGQINFSGDDGTRYLGAAFIKGVATTPIADYDVAGYLSFGTNYGTTSASERMRIDKDGKLFLGDGTYNSNSNGFKMSIKESSNENAAIIFLDTDNMRGGIVGSTKGNNELISGTGNMDFVVGSLYSDTFIISGVNGNTNGAIRMKVEGNSGKISINHVVGQDSPAGILDVRSEIGPHPLGSVFRKDYGGDTTDSSHKLALTLWGQDHNDMDHTSGSDFYGPMLGFGARIDDAAPNTGDIRAGISYVYNGHLTFHTETAGSVSDGTNERLRITGDGKVVAGNTGSGYTERLQAHGGGSTGGECLSLNSTGGNNIATELRFYENGTGRFRMRTQQGNPGIKFEDWTNGATRAEIAGDGDFKIHIGTRNWTTIAYRCSSGRTLRRHYREFGTGASGSVFDLIRVRRHYWGWGHYKFTIKRLYYSGIVEDVFYLNGHGRDDGSYNPSYTIGQRQYNGHGSNFGYSNRIQITSPSGSSPGDAYANYVDVQLNCPAYMYFVVEVEAASSGYSLDTSSISSDAYALHN